MPTAVIVQAIRPAQKEHLPGSSRRRGARSPRSSSRSRPSTCPGGRALMKRLQPQVAHDARGDHRREASESWRTRRTSPALHEVAARGRRLHPHRIAVHDAERQHDRHGRVPDQGRVEVPQAVAADEDERGEHERRDDARDARTGLARRTPGSSRPFCDMPRLPPVSPPPPPFFTTRRSPCRSRPLTRPRTCPSSSSGERRTGRSTCRRLVPAPGT